jgi:hypothetical protein
MQLSHWLAAFLVALETAIFLAAGAWALSHLMELPLFVEWTLEGAAALAGVALGVTLLRRALAGATDPDSAAEA